jgi:hypothetical protein
MHETMFIIADAAAEIDSDQIAHYNTTDDAMSIEVIVSMAPSEPNKVIALLAPFKASHARTNGSCIHPLQL